VCQRSTCEPACWMRCLCADDRTPCFRRESTIRTMTEATTEAEKHACRCEALAALLAEVRDKLQWARAVEADRARAEEEERARAVAVAAAAAEAEAEAEAAAAAETEARRLQMEEEIAALALRMQSDALRMQQMQAQLGVVVPAAPAENQEDNQCVVCMDAPKSRILLPCLHQCVCEACAQRMLELDTPSCPVCRAHIERIGQVFT
jgi:hypothetical protein